MKWEWKAPWMLALLTLQNVPALQLLHCRPLAQSPAEKHQNYVLDHVFLPQHPSIVFSVLSLLLALGALVPVRRAPRAAHPKRVPPRVRRAARFGLWSITTPHRELKVRPRVSQLRGKEIMWDCPWLCSVWRLLEFRERGALVGCSVESPRTFGGWGESSAMRAEWTESGAAPPASFLAHY